MLMDGLSSIGANLSIPIEKITLSQEKKEAASFAGILEEQNIRLEEDKEIDKCYDKWYRLGAYLYESERVKFFPDGSFETRNKPLGSAELSDDSPVSQKLNESARIFSSALEELKEQDIKLEPYQWYSLGTYSGQPVHIRFFPEGGGETSNRPTGYGTSSHQRLIEVGRIMDSFSGEDHEAISRDACILSDIFSALNMDFPVKGLHETMERVGYTISDVQNLLSQIEVSKGPSSDCFQSTDDLKNWNNFTRDSRNGKLDASWGMASSQIVDQIDDPYPFQPGDLTKALMEARFPKEPLKEEIEDEDKVQKEEGKERIERQVAAFLYEQNMILSTSA